MGYRLEIHKSKYTGFSGGKLYGYIDTDKLKELKSFRWLVDRYYLEENDANRFNYGFNPKIVLEDKDFKEFMKLYEEDFEKYYSYDKGWFYEQIHSEQFKELLEDDCDKILEWW